MNFRRKKPNKVFQRMDQLCITEVAHPHNQNKKKLMLELFIPSFNELHNFIFILYQLLSTLCLPWVAIFTMRGNSGFQTLIVVRHLLWIDFSHTICWFPCSFVFSVTCQSNNFKISNCVFKLRKYGLFKISPSAPHKGYSNVWHKWKICKVINLTL